MSSRAMICLFWWMFICVVMGTDGSSCGRQDKLQMTVVSIKPGQSESTRNPQPHYECYLGAGDAGATVEARRAYITRKYSYNNPDPISMASIGGLPTGTAGHNVTLATNNNRAFGGYYCESSKTGKQVTRIMAIFMHSTSYATPRDELSTKTVNIGDRDEIEIDWSSSSNNEMRWRVNSSAYRTDNLEGGDYVGLTDGATESDNGLYEFHGNSLRSSGTHGLKRLIVRSCKAGEWGPPGCTGICDNCYNGGVCDDETGRCICAPGFKGPNCLTACGKNRFGYHCEFECASAAHDYSCSRRQFCLLDPFGCRCSTGFQRLRCDQPCAAGTFGAGCLETCHCSSGSSCDRFTGVCESGECTSGWSGPNCQIPEICPTGYHGENCTEKCFCIDDAPCNNTTGWCPDELCAHGSMLNASTRKCEECLDGYYGDSCRWKCHCEADACDKVSGECVGCCGHQWDEYVQQKCQQGFIESEPLMVNPGQSPKVACTHIDITRNRGIGLSTAAETYNGVTEEEPILTETKAADKGFMQYTHVFSLPSEDPSGVYYCQLLSGDRTYVYAWVNTSYIISELPILTAAPTPVSRDQSSITIRWVAWNENTDVGDPPVVAYIPYHKMYTSKTWTNGSAVAFNGTLQYTVYGLEADTGYEFAVSAVREGPGGEGPRSDVSTIKTLCREPTAVPTDVIVALTEENHLNVSWKIDTTNFGCSTLSFTIYYMAEGSSDPPNSVPADGEDRWTIIDEGLEPGQSYSARVSLTTDGEFEGPRSALSEIVTISRKEDQQGTPPDGIILYIVPVVVAVLLVVIIVALILYWRKRKREMLPSPSMAFIVADQVHHIPNLEDGAVSRKEPNNINEQSEATEKEQSPPAADEDAGQTSATPIAKPAVTSRPSKKEDEYHEDLSERPPGKVYQNVQPSILVSDLPRYFNEHRSDIPGEFQRLRKNQQFPCTVGEKKENSKKNRFRKMYAYDHSRVILRPTRGDEQSDYYNASYISDQHGRKSFVASQAPNTASLNSFWVMIWQEEISTIVMLTNLIENGKDRCCQYWPDTEGTSKAFGPYVVSWAKASQFANFTVRELEVTLGNEVRTLFQFHYTTWPDMDVPEPGPLIEYIKHVKARQGDCQAPLLTHCSAGVGRTGTFIAIYCLMEVIKTEKKISIFDFVEKTRENRINMVQREVQYVFIYQCLVDSYLIRHTEMPSGLLAQFDIKAKHDTLTEEFKSLSTFQDEGALAVYEDQEERQRTRFPDMAPSMRGRIYLASTTSCGNSNFIHATVFTSLMKKDAFIATQSPLPDTVEDFWRLVYDWKCSTIVMLNQLQGNDETCVKYWPEDGTSQYGHMSVALTERKKHATHIHRQFEVSHMKHQGSLAVHQLQLLSWPTGHDFTPIKELKKSMTSIEEDDKAITLVHCIDGTGRSGVFVAVETALETVSVTGNIGVCNTVREMRRRNSHVVNTQEAYTLCYRIIKSMLSADETYANLGGM